MRIALTVLLGTFLFAFPASAALFGFLGDSMENVAAKDGVVAVDASSLDRMNARHYRYREDGKTVRFFVVRDGQGVVRAALDACEVCWREGKGYQLKNGTMLCVNCGRQFPFARIGLAAGGCNPHPVPYKVENESVMIAAQELMLGARYFPENGQ
jgi:uncharacterized membrane protein